MSLSKNQVGQINVLLIPLILSVVFLLSAIGFGAWSYSQMLDYKNNVDEKIEAAVAVAEDKKASEKDNEFLEKEKQPLREYASTSVFGDIKFSYPKTWSGYTKEDQDTLEVIMNPGLVSGQQKSVYALRLSVSNKTYAESVKGFDNAVKSGKAKASPIRLQKVPDALGTRIDGELDNNGIKGSLVILPLRDKSILIRTESEQTVVDFNTSILPSLSFNP